MSARAGGAGRPGRAQGRDRARLRRRSRRLGSGRRRSSSIRARLQQRHKLTPYAGRTLRRYRSRRRSSAANGVWDSETAARRALRSADGCCDDGSFVDLVRSGVRAPRRRRGRGERRVLRAEGAPDPRRRRRLARRRVHRARQMDGRLGDAPAARRRAHDWCIIRLGAPGIVRGVDVDTTHLQGQLSRRRARIDVCDLPALPAPDDDVERAAWREVLPRTPLTGDSHNLFAVERRAASHAPAPADFSRRRRRAAARLRRRRRRLGAACARRGRGRSRRRRARRPRRRVQRHVLRLAAQPDHAGRRDAHGRRVGNEAASRARARLDDRPSRRRGDDRAAWKSTRATSRATRRARAASTACAADDAPVVGQATSGRAVDASCCRGRRSSRTCGTRSKTTLRAIGDVTHVRFNIFPDGGVGRLRLFGRAEMKRPRSARSSPEPDLALRTLRLCG